MSTQSLARPFFLLAHSVALSILVTAIQVSEAHAQDMSARLEEFNHECFDNAGEFEPTDGCYEVSEQGCVTVDMTAPEVSGQDIDILTKSYGFDAKADNDHKLYSPECFEQGIVPFDFESMRSNACYDVLGKSEGDVWVEYIGCPGVGSSSEQAYTPLTQQGTPAPADWRSHVVPLKLAASPKSAATASKPSSTTEATIPTALKTSAYKVHEPRDTGRSQGQVVDKEHRDKAHAAATKVQSKLQAAEKAKKAASKKR